MLRRLGSSSALWAALAATMGVCLAQNASLGADSAAKIVALTGQVSVLHGSEPWALSVNDTVRPQQVIVTGPDGFASFQVSDGSTFEVFPNSRVTFRTNPTNWKDLVDVWIGRIKVHIQKLGGQPNNNNVHTPTAVISVRGTTFDVIVEDDDATTFVMVEEGQVAVRHRLRGGDPRLLNPGESIRVYKNEPLAKTVDRSNLIKAVLRAASEAIYSTVYGSPRSGGPTPAGGGAPPAGGGVPTDKPAPPPPPPPSGGEQGAPPPPPPPGA